MSECFSGNGRQTHLTDTNAGKRLIRKKKNSFSRELMSAIKPQGFDCFSLTTLNLETEITLKTLNLIQLIDAKSLQKSKTLHTI